MARMQRIADFLYKLVTLDIFPVFLIYLAVALLGPILWKKGGKTLQLTSVMIAYNVICSFINLYVAIGMTYALFKVDRIYTNTESMLLIPCYKVYAWSKMLELLDTVFMILRNRGRQISFLHVFHHSSMLILINYALRYSAWTALAPCLALNSFVHVLLYMYYAYTVLYPNMRPSWKRRLTEIQVIQFLIDLVYCTNGLINHDFCMWSFCYGVSMVALFGNFYLKAYVGKTECERIGIKTASSGKSL